MRTALKDLEPLARQYAPEDPDYVMGVFANIKAVSPRAIKFIRANKGRADEANYHMLQRGYNRTSIRLPDGKLIEYRGNIIGSGGLPPSDEVAVYEPYNPKLHANRAECTLSDRAGSWNQLYYARKCPSNRINNI